MSDHAGDALHYHGVGEKRYGHRHVFLHIMHEHDAACDECALLGYASCDCLEGGSR